LPCARTCCCHGSLSPAEEAEPRRHPVEGARLIAGTESFRRALPYVLYHHERWDGGGYPTGRAGADIPIEARLLSLADSFDAMVSHRPHRPALSVESALREVERCAGTQFDPCLADLFLRTWRSAVVDSGAHLATE
jgi:HD-GYP domain-containing protein (c-di-GMP phosphodiesterase class II)